ncbi:MAG: GNAT family N-acetyltransferase [Acidobacteria bacterium]|nr:GNAT family N-acetyltransferase [Acidobacteriota bacterium]
MIFSDLALSRRIEMANATSNAKIADFYKKKYDKSKASTLAIAGGYAIYLGDNSPLTQVLGIGLDKTVSISQIEELEDFYYQRNSAVNIELSPYVEPSLLEILANRGYRLIEVSNVLVKSLGKDKVSTSNDSEIEITSVDRTTIETWADIVSKGFGAEGEFAEHLKTVWQVSFDIADNYFFLAKVDSNPAGGGGLSIYQNIALFSGASTSLEFRKLGVQTKLLQHRLNLAIELGCDLAVISTLPGTISERNAGRQGFQVVYTRIKLMKPIKLLENNT